MDTKQGKGGGKKEGIRTAPVKNVVPDPMKIDRKKQSSGKSSGK